MVTELKTDAEDIIDAIERLQAAVGDDDRARIDDLICLDFHAFENGVHMTGRELLDAMSGHYARGRRYKWSVNSPQIEVQGDLGAAVYVNNGSIAEAPGVASAPQSWLETALLRRQGSRWRVAFLHSTRTKIRQNAT
jgi:ketosteroid isomerase-like protein